MSMAVEISATVGSSGSLHATEIELSGESGAESEIEGVVSDVDVDARVFSIGPVVLTYTPETRFSGLSRPETGTRVEVNIDVSDGQLIATRIDVDDER